MAAVVPLVLYMLREHTIAGASGFPLDDSWIHLQFARNLAEGHGFSYNPGQPVAGSTAPLWTILLGAGALIAGATPAMAKVLGIVATLGAALVTRRAALAWGAPASAALAAGVALLWTGPVAWGALSGMEVALAAFLVAASLLAHAQDRTALTAACAALAALARPEAVLLVPLLLLARPLTLRRAAIFVLVPAVILAPSVAFSLATVGSPMPATAAAKVEGGVIGWFRGIHESLWLTLIGRPWEFSKAWIGWLCQTHALLPVLLVAALLVVWRRGGRVFALPALVVVLHPLAMAWLAPYRAPSFQEGRYSIHLLPLAMIVLACATAGIGLRWRRPAMLGYLALALVALPAAAERYAWGVQNINGMQVALGHWIDANVPRAARLAVNDIGAIAFVSRRPVIDLMGLVTPDILPYRRRGEAGVMDYIRETCPDYVVIFPTWFPQISTRTDLLDPIHRVRLGRNEVSGGPEMVVYRLRRCTV